MKKKLIKYGSTSDYRSMVRSVHNMTRFNGVDEQGEAIYNSDPLPTLTLTGTTKLHGSNWGLSLQDDKLVCMSRNNLLGDTGHFGFPQIVKQNESDLLDLFTQIKTSSDYQDGEIITLYGEIVGPGVQKGVAISEIPEKILVYFAAKITRLTEDDDEDRWVQCIPHLKIFNDRIKNIYDFKTWTIDIDFENPTAFQNQLNQWTEEVGDECPVAKELGVSGVGEGIVWTTWYQGQRLIAKVKDERHTSSKIKKMANVDPIILQSINDFVDFACTKERMDQCIFEVGQQVKDIWDKSSIKDVINWIKSDIQKECLEELKDSNLKFKQVAGPISKQMTNHYFKEMQNHQLKKD